MPKQKSPKTEPIFLVRMTRENEERWQSARSWFGGQPAIDPLQWPRAATTNRPMHHLAHIDLADIPRGPDTPDMPLSGTLNFFVDTWLRGSHPEAQVFFSAQPMTTLVEPPEDCRPPMNGNGRPAHMIESRATGTYRRWPIEFRTEVASLGEPSMATHLLGDSFSPRFDPGVFPWDSISRIERAYGVGLQVHRKRKERSPSPWEDVSQEEHELKWAEMDAKLESGCELFSKWAELSATCDPYAQIGAEAAQKVHDDIRETYGESGALYYGGRATSVMQDAAYDTYRDMMAGSREAYGSIPEEIRLTIEENRRLSGSGWSKPDHHQMFGKYYAIQSNPGSRGKNILLFSAISDDMLSWAWGDEGVISFWISPENLAARNWDAAWALFEGR